MIQRIRELAVQSSNGVYSNEDRLYIQVEVSQLVDELDRIASHAQFNNINILTGRFADAGKIGGVATGSMWLHVGASMDHRKNIFIGTMTTRGLGIRQTGTDDFISLSTPENANASIGTLDMVLKKVNKQRADLGAYQTRFEMSMNGILIEAENLQAAESVIRDADMASEMVNYSKNRILVESTGALLTVANSKTKSMLQLME